MRIMYFLFDYELINTRSFRLHINQAIFPNTDGYETEPV